MMIHLFGRLSYMLVFKYYHFKPGRYHNGKSDEDGSVSYISYCYTYNSQGTKNMKCPSQLSS